MANLDRIEERLTSIDATLIRNTVSLEEHVKRTAMLEERFKPVEKHVWLIQGALRLIGGMALAAEAIRYFITTKG